MTERIQENVGFAAYVLATKVFPNSTQTADIGGFIHDLGLRVHPEELENRTKALLNPIHIDEINAHSSEYHGLALEMVLDRCLQPSIYDSQTAEEMMQVKFKQYQDLKEAARERGLSVQAVTSPHFVKCMDYIEDLDPREAIMETLDIQARRAADIFQLNAGLNHTSTTVNLGNYISGAYEAVNRGDFATARDYIQQIEAIPRRLQDPLIPEKELQGTLVDLKSRLPEQKD